MLWFAGGAVAVVWNVFRDTAMDYRLLVGGALLPEIVDGARGGARELHTLAASAAALVLVMVATRGRRLLRRRLLALPIGMFVHLVLDAAWARQALFWWPAFGWSLGGQELPSLTRPVAVVVVQELLGLAALVWAYGRFGLDDPDRRRRFLRTGRFDRELAAG